MNDNFERKLNKHKKKKSRLLHDVKRTQEELHSVNFSKIPIDEEPSYKKAYTTLIRTGDVVADIIEEQRTGLVVDVYWAYTSLKQSYDKKSGAYVMEHVCYPAVFVMWSDGSTETLDAKCLLKVA
jgi:hypothetical protein